MDLETLHLGAWTLRVTGGSSLKRRHLCNKKTPVNHSVGLDVPAACDNASFDLRHKAAELDVPKKEIDAK